MNLAQNVIMRKGPELELESVNNWIYASQLSFFPTIPVAEPVPILCLPCLPLSRPAPGHRQLAPLHAVVTSDPPPQPRTCSPSTAPPSVACTRLIPFLCFPFSVLVEWNHQWAALLTPTATSARRRLQRHPHTPPLGTFGPPTTLQQLPCTPLLAPLFATCAEWSAWASVRRRPEATAGVHRRPPVTAANVSFPSGRLPMHPPLPLLIGKQFSGKVKI